MRVRAVLVMSTLVACGLATAADAAKAPPPSCNIVKDAVGDSSDDFEGAPVFPADSGLDIVSADVASNAKAITAVIRLNAPPGSATLYAKRYIAQFNVAGLANPMVLAAAITPTGNTFSFGYYGDGTTGAGYNYDATAATGTIVDKVISVTVPLDLVAANTNLGVIKKGAKISAFDITANRRVPALTQVTGQVIPADEATGKGPYYAGNASCVKV